MGLAVMWVKAPYVRDGRIASYSGMQSLRLLLRREMSGAAACAAPANIESPGGPPSQAINLTVSGSLSVAGLLASTAYFAWWEV